MLISDQKQFIFVHIYKTGGSSLTRLLGPYVEEQYRAKVPRLEGAGWQGTWHYSGRQHAKLATLRSDPAWIAADLSQYRLCTIVRNPYTWVLSVWNDFYRREIDAPPWFTALFPARQFLDFCRLIRAARMGLNPAIWGCSPQQSFIADPEVTPAFVARFERLSEDIGNMLELLDIPYTEIPHEIRNHPEERSYARAFYDRESLSIINELFAADFEAFGYEVIQPTAP
jgi:hypothetical protein